MVAETEQAIRTRAYELWEIEGRPYGRALEHWTRAEQELGAGPSDLDRDPGIGSSRGAWKEDPEDDPTEGESTFEGDVMNDTTRTGGIDPLQRGRTNR